MKQFFSNLRLRHYAWAHVLIAAAIWWPLHIIFTTPDFLRENVNPVALFACMWIGLVGGIVKIAGFLASQQPGRAGVLGVSVELIGLALALAAPIAYIFSYGSLLTTELVNFGSAFIFAYAIIAMYLYRATILIPRFRKEGSDSSKGTRRPIPKDFFADLFKE